jgi:hypothetical protein
MPSYNEGQGCNLHCGQRQEGTPCCKQRSPASPEGGEQKDADALAWGHAFYPEGGDTERCDVDPIVQAGLALANTRAGAPAFPEGGDTERGEAVLDFSEQDALRAALDEAGLDEIDLKDIACTLLALESAGWRLVHSASPEPVPEQEGVCKRCGYPAPKHGPECEGFACQPPEGGDTERCPVNGHKHDPLSACPYCEFDPLAPASRGAEQERWPEELGPAPTHAESKAREDPPRYPNLQKAIDEGRVVPGENKPDPRNRTFRCPEHGAEGDEEPPGEQIAPVDRTEEALRKRIAEADEQINRLHATLTEARRRADDAAGWVVEHEAELEHQHALRETAEQKATELAALAYHPYQCSCGKGPHGKGAGIMGSDAPEAGPDCRPLTWKEVAERASESATARRKEGRDIFRQLRSAEALAQRRGEALERIAKWPCHNSDTGDEPECPDLDIQDFRWCPPCDARSVLENDRG